MYLKSHLCIPDNVTLGQTAKIVSKFLEENPEHLHQPAQSLVYAALYIAFPCEDGQWFRPVHLGSLETPQPHIDTHWLSPPLPTIDR